MKTKRRKKNIEHLTKANVKNWFKNTGDTIKDYGQNVISPVTELGGSVKNLFTKDKNNIQPQNPAPSSAGTSSQNQIPGNSQFNIKPGKDSMFNIPNNETTLNTTPADIRDFIRDAEDKAEVDAGFDFSLILKPMLIILALYVGYRIFFK